MGIAREAGHARPLTLHPSYAPEIVITGLDPVIHPPRKQFLVLIDGLPGQARQ